MAWIIGVLIAVLIAGRSIAEFVIEYQWWKEMGQLPPGKASSFTALFRKLWRHYWPLSCCGALMRGP